MLAGPQATRMLSESHKDEIRTAVPGLTAAFDGGPCAQPVRPIISWAVLKSVKERHQKNDAMVVEETEFFNMQPSKKMFRRWVYNPPLTTAHPVSALPSIKPMRHF